MDFKNLLQKFKDIPYKTKTSFTNKVTMSVNFIWAIFKLIFAFFISSVFLSVSGFYTLCTGLAKTAYFDGRRLAKNQIQETKYFKRISWTIFCGGLLYVFYILELFIHPKIQDYTTIISIAIATIAFCEIFFAVRGLIKSKKSNDFLLLGLKCINLSSALSSIVLTQIALLSALTPLEISIFFNILTGIFVGFIIMSIAIFMLTKLYKFKENSFKLIKTTLKYKRFNNLKFLKKKNYIYVKYMR